MNDSVKVLEEKIAYLERHVVEQDKAMLELADDLTRLRKEMLAMRGRLLSNSPGEGNEAPEHERPPHY